jgi:hypothetical protein
MKTIKNPNEIQKIWMLASTKGLQLHLTSIGGKGYRWVCTHPEFGFVVGEEPDISEEDAMWQALEDCHTCWSQLPIIK